MSTFANSKDQDEMQYNVKVKMIFQQMNTIF